MGLGDYFLLSVGPYYGMHDEVSGVRWLGEELMGDQERIREMYWALNQNSQYKH